MLSGAYLCYGRQPTDFPSYRDVCLALGKPRNGKGQDSNRLGPEDSAILRDDRNRCPKETENHGNPADQADGVTPLFLLGAILPSGDVGLPKQPDCEHNER